METIEFDMEIRKEKSRNQGVYGFFEALQAEWIVADLRLRLYPKTKDKDYWKKVRDGKKITIEEISEKNSLPTIFTDAAVKADYESRVFRKQSYPNFHYKDENNRMAQEFHDLTHYYAKDSDVRCEIEGATKVGKVKAFNPLHDKCVTVIISGAEVKVLVEHVTRIL